MKVIDRYNILMQPKDTKPNVKKPHNTTPHHTYVIKVRILKHTSVLHLHYFKTLYLNLHEFLRCLYGSRECDNFYIINWKNTLGNLASYLSGLEK